MASYTPLPPSSDHWLPSSWSKLANFLSYPRNYVREIGPNCEFNKTGKTTEKISHTNMNGGTYYVADEYLSHFNRFLIEDLKHGHVLPPFTEIHTPLFPMFFDVDMALALSTPSVTFSNYIAGIIQDVITKFYPRPGDEVATGIPPEADWFHVVVCSKHINGREACQPLPVKDLSEWEELDDSVTCCVRRNPPDYLTEALRRSKLRFSPGDLKQHGMQSFHIESNECVEVHVDASTVRRFRPKQRLWKHGLHIHIPELIVNVDRAALLRMGLVDTLSKNDLEVEEMLQDGKGKHVIHLQWEKIIDEGVYKHNLRGGGLRMIGAPKSKRCPAAPHPRGTVCKCQVNNGKLIDPYYYWPNRVYCGRIHTTMKPKDVSVPEDIKELIKMTTVRCSAKVEETKGGIDYEGHRIKKDSMWATRDAPQRARFQLSKTEKLIARRRSYNGGIDGNTFLTDSAVIQDSAKLRVIRKVLVNCSGDGKGKHYANVKFVARVPPLGGDRIIVTCSGEGAGFCLNLNGTHNSANVFMIIRREGGGKKRANETLRYEGVIYCRCNHEIVRSGGVMCKNFEHRFPIEHADAAVLFPLVVDPTSDRGITEKMRLDAALSSCRKESTASSKRLRMAHEQEAESSNTNADDLYEGLALWYESQDQRFWVTILFVQTGVGPTYYMVRLPDGSVRNCTRQQLTRESNSNCSNTPVTGPLSMYMQQE